MSRPASLTAAQRDHLANAADMLALLPIPHSPELARTVSCLATTQTLDTDLAAHACAEHVWQLRPFVDPYGAHAVDVGDATTPGFLETLRQGMKAIGHTPVAGVALLHDLRDVYVLAHRVEIDWIVLQQASKAARATDLLAVTGACAEAAEQTWKWLRTRITQTAPEALATS